jgi:cytochrome d ubiquinol oxidase subunit I
MQHPVAYARTADGSVALTSFWALILNPWALWQYAHNMAGAALTGAFVMMAVGAFYLLSKQHLEQSKIFLKVGVVSGLLFSILLVGPTGDGQGRNLAEDQPATLAAMEALFQSQHGAPLLIIGQPDLEQKKIDNPIAVPRILSFLAYRNWNAHIKGLDAFPPAEWPQNISLLYYSYHIMVGLGTIFMAVMLVAGVLLWRRRLFQARWMLWILMMSFPLPYIANTAGWMTAEIGRQPYLIYGLLRTAEGYSKTVSAGNGWFTLLGFLGMYSILSILFLFLIRRELEHGPEPGPSLPGVAGGLPEMVETEAK